MCKHQLTVLVEAPHVSLTIPFSVAADGHAKLAALRMRTRTRRPVMVHTCTKFYPNGIFALGDDYRYIPASVDAYIHARASRSTTQKIIYYGRTKALTRGFRYSFCYALSQEFRFPDDFPLVFLDFLHRLFNAFRVQGASNHFLPHRTFTLLTA